jgi:SET domain-containing protein
MSQADIDYLNSIVRLRVAPSPVHGVGIFATKDIPKGTKLYADQAPLPYKISKGNLDKLFPDVKDLLLERWPRMVEGEAFAFPDIFFQGYMNHSDDPNYDNKTDTTLKDIQAGEEIFEDYRNIPGWEQVYTFLKK